MFFYVTSHKKELIEKAKIQVSEKLNGNVQIGNIDLSFTKNFPQVSLLLENVSVTDTMYSVHHHAFLQAEKIYAILGIGNVMLQNNPLSGIRIDNAKIYVFTDTTGYTNAYLFSPKKSTDTSTKKSTAKTEIESIKLRNVRIVMDDQLKNKLYDFEAIKVSYKINTEDSVLTVRTKNDILIHSLAFNTQIGSYVKETSFEGNFYIAFDLRKKQLSFKEIEVNLKKQPFTLSGQFNFTDSPTFSLKVFTKNINFQIAKSLVTPKIASAISLVDIDKAVEAVTADINGPLKGGEPLVKVNWIIKNTAIKSSFVNLSDCSLSGSFINEVIPGQPRNDPNSQLHFQHLTAVYEGLPVQSENVYINNLLYPRVTCDVKANFELPQLNKIIGSNTLKLKEGKGLIDITYEGPLENNTKQNTLLNGKVKIDDGYMVYSPRNIQMKNVSGNVLFKNTDVYVTDFKGNVQGNKIMMNGSGKNLLALIETNPGLMFLDWNIYSPSINFNSLTSLLQKRNPNAKAPANDTKLGSTANQLDLIVEYANFRINVKADEILYRRFKASNVNAALSLINENWSINSLSLQHAGGNMHINGTLFEKNSTTYEANIKAKMENVDVNKVMYAFDNFGQRGIEAENLKGKLTSLAEVKLNIDRNTEQPSNLIGFVDFSLKNGALLHYEPLKKVQTIIFKNRNFDEIHFAELKDRIEIKNNEFTINRMEIQSTALTLFVEGLYSAKGNTDISIQVPISNLKKRGEDYTPENKGVDQKGGASIYIRGQTGTDGNVAFKLDVFKKLRKQKPSVK